MATKTAKSKKAQKKSNKEKKAQAAEEEEEEENGAAENLEVSRDDARGLLLALGLKSSAKGDDAKMLGKLKSLDEADDDADPGKYKKLYKQVIEANTNGVEIVLTGDEENGEGEKPAKKSGKDKEAKAAKKSGGKKGGGGAVGRGPGVISEIEAILKAATKKAPVTKSQIVEKLAKKFKDRSADAMAKTVAVQVPGRISSEKGFAVHKVATDDGAAYYAGK